MDYKNFIMVTDKIKYAGNASNKNAGRIALESGIKTGKALSGKIYRLSGEIKNREFLSAAARKFCDPICQDYSINEFQWTDKMASYILVSKKKGMCDDEGTVASEMLSVLYDTLSENGRIEVKVSEIHIFENEISLSELENMASGFFGNPVINDLKFGKYNENLELPECMTPVKERERTKEVNIFISYEKLLDLSRSRNLSLDLEEMKAIHKYYSDPATREKRKNAGFPAMPTDCELETIAQTWSEHCKHKEFKATIEYEDLDKGAKTEIRSLFDTFIKGATKTVSENLSASGKDWLVKAFNDNAGMVMMNESECFAWKVETHNSPSAIDPYGGAVTGILGCNRDPLGTGNGGARLIFNTDVLCFAGPEYEKNLLPGQLHPQRVLDGVCRGIMDGGNKTGVPTINGSVIFDDRYAGKPLVFCGSGAVIPGACGHEKTICEGDLIVMAGGLVGKDGIHGATFSSKELEESSPRSAVQIGSPFTQKKLMDFLSEAHRKGLFRTITDNGAGGLSSSVGELAALCGGAKIDLEKVPLKYEGLAPWEILISESQERMTLAVAPKNFEEIKKLAEYHGIKAAAIGHFNSDGTLTATYGGEPAVLLDMSFLHEGVPLKKLRATWKKPEIKTGERPYIYNFGETILKLMESPNICSREPLIRTYDHEVQGQSILKPLMGGKGPAPQDATVIRTSFGSFRGIAVSCGIMPKYGDLDAYHMAAGAFDEAVRQIISVGGKLPLHAKDRFNFWSLNDNFCVPDSVYDPAGNPDGKYKLAQLIRMCQALYDMAVYFNIPFTSGKDSMKNDFKSGGVKLSIPPTVLISAAAAIEDVRNAVPSYFNKAGDAIYLLGATRGELGCSEFHKMLGISGGKVPKVNMEQAKNLYLRVMEANEQKIIESCHDISDGGLAAAIAECLFGEHAGASIELKASDGLDACEILFSESHSRFVVSIRPEKRDKFEKIMGGYASIIGVVTKKPELTISLSGQTLAAVNTSELLKSWTKGGEKIWLKQGR
jgi:phosphoribosylformylglycinamidine synthase